MRPLANNKNWKRPKANFFLKPKQRREVLRWIKALMFPNRYAVNLSRGVNLGTMRVNRMKSPDYHLWIEWLLSVMVRGYVPEHV
jgi:hypothetical protein